ncbi:hypothetical protein [Paenibacillus sp. UNC451MF]|uniref:hypothetical protein n=1 Tax=Paenibacillus sp. UNC451MF TaxID=1449063 RepID=UPI00048D241F|nr:hypothetical protein [Paenibacillus sp. UNC451MF]
MVLFKETKLYFYLIVYFVVMGITHFIINWVSGTSSEIIGLVLGMLVLLWWKFVIGPVVMLIITVVELYKKYRIANTLAFHDVIVHGIPVIIVLLFLGFGSLF